MIYIGTKTNIVTCDLTKSMELRSVLDILIGSTFSPLISIKGAPEYVLFATKNGPEWGRYHPSQNGAFSRAIQIVEFDEVFDSLPPDQQDVFIYYMDLI